MKKFILILLLTVSVAQGEEVNLYTDRQAIFLEPVLSAFEQQSGMEVNVLFIKNGLMERMQAERGASVADVVMVVDVARLQDFIDEELLAKHGDAHLSAQVPPSLQNDYWLAVTQRVRALFVPIGSERLTYDDLVRSEYQQGICMRSGKHTYNIGLIAEMIARHGEAATRDWLVGVRGNLARRPVGKDRTQIGDVASGKCKVGIANSYYYFQMLKNPDNGIEDKVEMVIPDRAHINITGIALAAGAKNKKQALQLMQFLVSPAGQKIYAEQNGEFPVIEINLPATLKSFYPQLQGTGEHLHEIAKYRRQASDLVEDIEFDL